MKVFITANGFLERNAEGVIEYQTEKAALIRLTPPLSDSTEYLVAQVRHEGVKMEDLQTEKNLLCNVTATTNDVAKSENPVDLSWWRGGKATITDINI